MDGQGWHSAGERIFPSVKAGWDDPEFIGAGAKGTGGADCSGGNDAGEFCAVCGVKGEWDDCRENSVLTTWDFDGVISLCQPCWDQRTAYRDYGFPYAGSCLGEG